MSRRYVLDASALLAVTNEEPGGDLVESLLDQCAISVVNVAEVASKFCDIGVSDAEIEEFFETTPIRIVDFDKHLSLRAGSLRSVTRMAGLSLADRACLVTAQSLDAIALTSDRVWKSLSDEIDVKIELIR